MGRILLSDKFLKPLTRSWANTHTTSWHRFTVPCPQNTVHIRTNRRNCFVPVTILCQPIGLGIVLQACFVAERALACRMSLPLQPSNETSSLAVDTIALKNTICTNFFAIQDYPGFCVRFEVLGHSFPLMMLMPD